MPVYPFTPTPSSISAPAFVDPMYEFATDAGVTVRRPMVSRPRRRYQLDYLGLTVADMRLLHDFMLQQRLGVLPFEWLHMTALDFATFANTTPVILTMAHSFVTGQWVAVLSSPYAALNNLWQITRLSATTFSLIGSSAGGTGPCLVQVYLPQAVGVFSQGTMESPVKLMGPDSAATTRGRFSMSVLVEELL